MTPLSFLVLTDHSGHSDQNSVYSLVTTLAADPRCAYVDVASRGDARNHAFFRGGNAQVLGTRVTGALVYDAEGAAFASADRSLDPTAYDVIWLRLPHPVPTAFFAFLADLAPAPPAASGPVIVNNPAGIAQTGDKAFLQHFPDWTPPARLVRTAEETQEFLRHFPLVLKPLRAYGGKGILRIERPDEVEKVDFTEPYLAMKFLQHVSEGDKRILVVNGRIMAASLRLPAPGEWLCNVAQGGKSVSAEVTPRERAMIEALSPTLLHHGICFAGVDTLVGDDGLRVLSEINTLSIGGFPQAEAQTGRPILQQTIDELFTYCYDHA